MTLKAACAAVILAAAFSTNAWAQDNEPSAQPQQEQTVPDPDAQAQQDGMADQDAPGEAMDPASPEADAMGEPMDGMPETDTGEAAEPEDTGPADMISDSSERNLSRADVEMLDCDELWIARNEIFDRNGYCFRSARGEDYFDNSDCTSDSQDILSSLEWENVRLIQSVEREKQCN
jgi:hypothetical protein